MGVMHAQFKPKDAHIAADFPVCTHFAHPCWHVGLIDGDEVGVPVGMSVGDIVGVPLGRGLGTAVTGVVVGAVEGALGLSVGLAVGASVVQAQFNPNDEQVS